MSTTYLPILAQFPAKENIFLYVAFLIAVAASAVPCVFLIKGLLKTNEKEHVLKTWSVGFFIFGLMFVIAGLFVYWIFGSYGKPAAIVHGLGVGLIFAVLLEGSYESINFISGKTIFFNISSVVTVGAALGLLIYANQIVIKRNKTFDFNKRKLQSLDSATVTKLKALKEPVKVLIFVTKKERNQTPRIKDFFDKYRSVNRTMFKVQFVNPLSEPDIASCYGVREGKGGKMTAQILITKGKCVKGQGKDSGLTFKGKKLNITQLKEEHVTNRMIRITRSNDKKICFLTGRKQPATTGNKTAIGFHFFKKVLEDKGFKTKTIDLASVNEVPKECRMLINAAPELLSVRRNRHAHLALLSAQEVDKVKSYLNKGGKMLLFLEPRIKTGLAPLLKKNYGIEWQPGLTLEFRNNVGRPEIFFAGSFDTRHVITKGFKKAGVRTYFWNASALKKAKAVPGVNVSTLIKTEQIIVPGMRLDPKTGRRVRIRLKCCSFYIPRPYGMRFSYLQREYVKIRPVLMARKAVTGFVERIMPKAQRGSFGLAMSAAKKAANGKETRIVVLADSFLASNRGVRFRGYGNITLLINSIGWLAHEKDLVALPPKNRKVQKLAMTAVTRNAIQYTTRYAMPVFFFLMILMVMGIRRQK